MKWTHAFQIESVCLRKRPWLQFENGVLDWWLVGSQVFCKHTNWYSETCIKHQGKFVPENRRVLASTDLIHKKLCPCTFASVRGLRSTQSLCLDLCLRQTACNQKVAYRWQPNRSYMGPRHVQRGTPQAVCVRSRTHVRKRGSRVPKQKTCFDGTMHKSKFCDHVFGVKKLGIVCCGHYICPCHRTFPCVDIECSLGNVGFQHRTQTSPQEDLSSWSCMARGIEITGYATWESALCFMVNTRPNSATSSSRAAGKNKKRRSLANKICKVTLAVAFRYQLCGESKK